MRPAYSFPPIPNSPQSEPKLSTFLLPSLRANEGCNLTQNYTTSWPKKCDAHSSFPFVLLVLIWCKCYVCGKEAKCKAAVKHHIVPLHIDNYFLFSHPSLVHTRLQKRVITNRPALFPSHCSPQFSTSTLVSIGILISYSFPFQIV